MKKKEIPKSAFLPWALTESTEGEKRRAADKTKPRVGALTASKDLIDRVTLKDTVKASIGSTFIRRHIPNCVH